jgi:hypothetical protein
MSGFTVSRFDEVLTKLEGEGLITLTPEGRKRILDFYLVAVTPDRWSERGNKDDGDLKLPGHHTDEEDWG